MILVRASRRTAAAVAEGAVRESAFPAEALVARAEEEMVLMAAAGIRRMTLPSAWETW